jgi:cell division transport system permease protein
VRLLQAFRYFAREAAVGLLRSWRVSLLASLTIAVSLFLAGAFLLVSRNLERSIAEWRAEARFVVYLDDKAAPAELAELERRLRASEWVSELERISPELGAERFRAAFPALDELVDDARYGSLPASFEARLRPAADADRARFEAWSAALAGLPGVETIDDDRDWIAQVETLLALERAIGAVLTAILLGAAVFTIAAVVRLTSLLYRDEIAIMRLVGATEFFIRGPFYLEGVLQGLIGAAAAVAGLRAAHAALAARLESSIVLAVAGREFLSGAESAALLAFGAAAGLGGALVSLGRERPTSEGG